MTNGKPTGRRSSQAALVFVLLSAFGCNSSNSSGIDAGAVGPWNYLALDGAVCGNGTDYGVAINGRDGATQLVIFLNGGGACWDTNSCFVLNAATHIADTLSPQVVLAEARQLEGWLFSRNQGVGPFADATLVFAPYCTGDLHSGRRVASYEVLGGTRDVHHMGADNVQRLFDKLKVDFAGVDEVWLVGASAGGFGALINWWRLVEAFPDAQVHVIDDSGPPVNVPGGRWGEWKTAWAMELPPQCTDCGDGLSSLIPYYSGTMNGRLGLLSYDRDATIALYYGSDGELIFAGLNALKTAFSDAGWGLFQLAGVDHVVLANPSRSTSTGEVAADWIDALLSDDPTWTSVGP